MTEYINKENIILDYSGLTKIAPNDFTGIAKYFADQIKAMPAADVVEAVKCMDIRIIHHSDGTYDVYDKTKNEFLFSTSLADDLFVLLSDMGYVRIQFADMLIRNMHMLNLYE